MGRSGFGLIRITLQSIDVERSLARLEIPITELAPEEPIQRLGRLAEIVVGQRRGQLADDLVKPEQNPPVVAGQAVGDDVVLDLAALHLAKAAGIPELVAEVAAQLDVLLI